MFLYNELGSSPFPYSSIQYKSLKNFKGRDLFVCFLTLPYDPLFSQIKTRNRARDNNQGHKTHYLQQLDK